MTIIEVPNPILLEVSKPLQVFDKKIVEFIKEMEFTLIHKKNPEGVGLSAPQVGRNLRIFSLYFNHKKPESVRTLINPVVVESSKEMTLAGKPDKPFLEGCLSIPEVYGPVWRHESITLEYSTLDTNTLELTTKTETFKDFEARVVQHEYDHLEGILFTRRALEQGLKLYRDVDGELEEVLLD